MKSAIPLTDDAGGPPAPGNLCHTIITSTLITTASNTTLAWSHSLTPTQDKKCSYVIKYSQNEKSTFGRTEDPGTLLA